ncbi:hypothetical protein WJX73_008120 [Symbiochloris irregularis]|uniref:Uncharacterized protein n=1 Tax=Symbiochloris irregularis TaxID=706552 RepID=A0AAW1PA76_9CHLO
MLRQHNLSIPKNVHVVEFAPQNDLLGHRAVRAFVTQGGSNSALEGLYHGVPMIMIPLYVEQPLNANRIQNLGAGIALQIASPINPRELAQNLGTAFERVLATDSYAEKARHISKLMRAERWTPAQKAASLIENVAWTNGSTHTHMLRNGPSWVAVHNLLLSARQASSVPSNNAED